MLASRMALLSVWPRRLSCPSAQPLTRGACRSSQYRSGVADHPGPGGCGPNAWRGPWGHCRNTPYYGPLLNGYYQLEPHPVFGCPEGYWRGPWGHCRNTPYHGPPPNGGWK